MRNFLVVLSCCVFYLFSCSTVKHIQQVQPQLFEEDKDWVNVTLDNLSLDQKIGQMFMPFARYKSYLSGSNQLNYLIELITKYHVGGFVIRSADAYETLKFNNQLQSVAEVPLLIANDYETGVGGRTYGGTEFISAMGVGATGNPDYAYEVGKITALESRALGINLLFAPCADVNTNPLNKIINIRSFGEDPVKVAQFVKSFVNGAQDNGILATVKHFPGHGGTAIDSHYELPVFSSDLSQLYQQDLIPFNEAINNDVAAIMTAHIAFPQIAEEKEVPATLSWKILDELLRENLQFDGLVITDALAMAAIKENYFEGKSIVKAIHAGVDILLIPQNLPLTYFAVQQAVQQGEISTERINQSVRRILTWKSKLGLQKSVFVSEEFLDQELSKPTYQSKSEEISQDAVTVLRNTALPLKLDRNPNLLVLSYDDRQNSTVNGQAFVKSLKTISESTTHLQIKPGYCKEELEKSLKYVYKSDLIINTFHFKRTSSPDSIKLSEYQIKLLDTLSTKNDSMINIFFGSPYYAMNFPNANNFVFIYRNSIQMEKIAADMVMGKFPVKGKLPVSIPGIANSGDGENIEKYDMQLEKGDYKKLVHNPQCIDSLQIILQQSIADSAFPGCAIAVGNKGKLIFSDAFGRFTYDPNSNKVKTNSIFDLASVTKVVSTTSAAMFLHQRGLLDINWKVQDILPEFLGKEKGLVTVKHLLTHCSGLPAWRRYYLTLTGQDQILKAIYAEELEFTPGTLTMYSDLGMILMQKIIEVITQQKLNHFVDDNIYKPLGMNRTFYKPDISYINEIVPTEYSDWHGKVVHGFVHDENTYAMGGISGHAGLFSTVEDLAKYCQMLLNNGVYNQKKVFKKKTIELFTKRSGFLEGSTRAIGWDTRSEESSSSGHYMSMRAFGHTGFTGTSIWLDPENEVFVVLLTNRVHPTRENQKIRKVRPKVADLVMKAILSKTF
ncbi:glycoside hydrolase family 3 N-terminal domain-containing protein [Calditrichota bacterium]